MQMKTFLKITFGVFIALVLVLVFASLALFNVGHINFLFAGSDLRAVAEKAD